LLYGFLFQLVGLSCLVSLVIISLTHKHMCSSCMGW